MNFEKLVNDLKQFDLIVLKSFQFSEFVLGILLFLNKRIYVLFKNELINRISNRLTHLSNISDFINSIN